MVLVPTIYALFPTCFKDFREKEGCEGADPDSNEARSRMQHVSTVTNIFYPRKEKIEVAASEFPSVDNSWVNTMLGGEALPEIDIEDPVPSDKYQYHCRFRVLDGEAAGAEINIKELDGSHIVFHPENGGSNNQNPFKNPAF